MKKSLIALAVMAAAGAASAQSSVTLFGIVDATIAYGRASGAGNDSRTQVTNSGYNSSRLGFRGTEDLGGGMSASFWLEAGISNDDGRAGGGIPAGNQATTVAGNSTLDKTTVNALKVLELCDRREIPVAAGAPRPLVRELVVAEHRSVQAAEELPELAVSAQPDPALHVALHRQPDPLGRHATVDQQFLPSLDHAGGQLDTGNLQIRPAVGEIG